MHKQHPNVWNQLLEKSVLFAYMGNLVSCSLVMEWIDV